MTHAAQIHDPKWLHRQIVKLHRERNVAHIRLLLLLDHAIRNCLHLQLGYVSMEQYMAKHLHLKRSTAFEYLRIGRALNRLLEVRSAYEEGRICYSQLRELTRICEEDTQGVWLDRAAEISAEQLRFEVRDALESGRKVPRDDARGLPNLKVDVSFRCTLEDREMVTQVIKMLREEIRGSKVTEEGERIEVSADEAIVYLFRRKFDGHEPGSTSSGNSKYAVVYHQCMDCKESIVDTEVGAVRVDSDRVDAVEGEADRVTIRPEGEQESPQLPAGEKDRPNTTLLARKVLARDSHRCSNPGCGRRTQLQAHHIRFRSAGGRTAMFNETTVCAVCHALIHEGVLAVTGDPRTGLTWRARGDSIRVPRTPSPESTAWTHELPRSESTARTQARDWQHLSGALETLGWSKSAARARILHAVAQDPGADNEQQILKRALATSVPTTIGQQRRSI